MTKKSKTHSNKIKKFEERNRKFIQSLDKDEKLKELSRAWFLSANKHEYQYHFSWLGRPIIQFPQDIIIAQEIIWKVKPDLIIETGIAHGGSLILYASILELLGKGVVLGIDIDIRTHNRKAIQKHPLYKRIKMIEGSSIDETTIKKVKEVVKNKKRILIFLDSNHSHEHVLKELRYYSPLISKDSYIIVSDTVIDNIPKNSKSEHDFNRPWNENKNPKTAIFEFLRSNKRFRIDKEIEKKLLITSSPSGFLKCIKN